MTLSDLLETIAPIRVTGWTEDSTKSYEIGSIHYRAQDVLPGGLFVAIKGFNADGHDFIDDALARGASVIVTEKPVAADSICIEVANTRRALASMAGRFYNNPSETLSIIGITGTNGKTTTAFLIENILLKAGFDVGVIGTINYRYSGKVFPNPMTTPESLDLQKILKDMEKDRITHVVMEVSSHALDLFRVDNCWMDVGVFTNFSQDHLDYHKDMAGYWMAKQRFFTEILQNGPKKERALAVFNCNDEKGRSLREIFPGSGVTVGHSPDNMIRDKTFTADLNGIKGEIMTPDGLLHFISPLAGAYNLENILCAVGVGIAFRLPLYIIRNGIETLGSVPGRFERIPNESGKFVFVDYAHTPGALKNVLSALKSTTQGRIICIFGCGGDRDREKRPQMGEIAGNMSDLAVITSDNPRSEEPMDIIRQICIGTQKTCGHHYSRSDLKRGVEKKGYIIESDRRKAIHLGISAARAGDTVLIAGKGHENYQIVGNKTISFDDRSEAEKILLN
ncbi:MAG: UDP-N-acetylmuramoyl-L-alanyl-D-glutamate--2,6-diaminopimelate ligase [Desulfobacterales bacterium]